MLIFIFLSLFIGYASGNYQNRDYCSLYGVVFVEKEKSRADYLVYLEENEAFADLVVYREPNRLFADKRGLWHYSANRSLADFTIFFVQERHQAHFSISYTNSSIFAGCQ